MRSQPLSGQLRFPNTLIGVHIRLGLNPVRTGYRLLKPFVNLVQGAIHLAAPVSALSENGNEPFNFLTHPNPGGLLEVPLKTVVDH
jgi:hypothetical protein